MFSNLSTTDSKRGNKAVSFCKSLIAAAIFLSLSSGRDLATRALASTARSSFDNARTASLSFGEATTSAILWCLQIWRQAPKQQSHAPPLWWPSLSEPQSLQHCALVAAPPKCAWTFGGVSSSSAFAFCLAGVETTGPSAFWQGLLEEAFGFDVAGLSCQAVICEETCTCLQLAVFDKLFEKPTTSPKNGVHSSRVALVRKHALACN